MLRRTLMASVGAIALTGSAAFAADLRPPPVYLPPPPVFTWTGLYVGINAGGTWSSSNSVRTATANLDPGNFPGPGTAFNIASAALASTSNSAPNSGFIGGGQIGYNLQFWNNFVAGIEVDIQGIAGSNGNTTVTNQGTAVGFETLPIDQTLTVTRSQDYLGTVRGRLGFTITPTLLVYGTGGLAYGQTNSSTSITQFVQGVTVLPNSYSSFGSLSNTRVGWTAGGGAEWMFLPNWSFKAEYLYYDLGGVTYGLSPLQNFATVGGGTLFSNGAPVSTASFRGNIVRAGLNYHFNLFPAPIVAKY